jgi:hypothetical protein
MMITGRFAENLGYLFVVLAVVTTNSLVSGICLGLAGLCYPLPLALGTVVLAPRLDPVLFATAFLVCAWWYVPFVIKARKIAFLKETRRDKLLGVYRTQWASMINLVAFLFLGFWPAVAFFAGQWALAVAYIAGFLPGRRATRAQAIERLARLVRVKPFWTTDLPQHLPGLDEITEPVVLIKQPPADPAVLANDDDVAGSLKIWVWACACYLIDKGIVVYNGIPSTEVPHEKTVTESIPPDIRSYWVHELATSSGEADSHHEPFRSEGIQSPPSDAQTPDLAAAGQTAPVVR